PLDYRVCPTEDLCPKPVAGSQQMEGRPLGTPPPGSVVDRGRGKRFCGRSGRKIDSNNTLNAHQRFTDSTTSIQLLRDDDCFQRFLHSLHPKRTPPDRFRCEAQHSSLATLW